jgi:3-phosphoshikimate 1-carboxyvinyltransferase
LNSGNANLPVNDPAKPKSQIYFQIKSNQKLAGQDYFVQVDASGCSYFWAIGALSGCPIRIPNISPDSVQGDVQFAFALEKMGCQVSSSSTLNNSFVEVCGPKDLKHLEPVKIDMQNMPDVAQTLAVVCACANGTSRLTGLKTLRIKETDRILALHQELKKLGVTTRFGDDWLEIDGNLEQILQSSKENLIEIETYHDHRMAMSFSVLSVVVDRITIKDSEVVSKSFPNFWDLLAALRSAED